MIHAVRREKLQYAEGAGKYSRRTGVAVKAGTIYELEITLINGADHKTIQVGIIEKRGQNLRDSLFHCVSPGFQPIPMHDRHILMAWSKTFDGSCRSTPAIMDMSASRNIIVARCLTINFSTARPFNFIYVIITNYCIKDNQGKVKHHAVLHRQLFFRPATAASAALLMIPKKF
jgi:hypothetical protein